jgi:hypothetical protein
MIELDNTWISLIPLVVIGMAASIIIVISLFAVMFILAVIAIDKIKDIKDDDCDF